MLWLMPSVALPVLLFTSTRFLCGIVKTACRKERVPLLLFPVHVHAALRSVLAWAWWAWAILDISSTCLWAGVSLLPCILPIPLLLSLSLQQAHRLTDPLCWQQRPHYSLFFPPHPSTCAAQQHAPRGVTIPTCLTLPVPASAGCAL